VAQAAAQPQAVVAGDYTVTSAPYCARKRCTRGHDEKSSCFSTRPRYPHGPAALNFGCGPGRARTFGGRKYEANNCTTLSKHSVVLIAGCPSVPAGPPSWPARVKIANGIIEHSAFRHAVSTHLWRFSRALAVRQYDAGGLNVSVAYNLASPGTPIASHGLRLPLAVPALNRIAQVSGRRCKKHIVPEGSFSDARMRFTQAHGGAQPTIESDVSPPGDWFVSNRTFCAFHLHG